VRRGYGTFAGWCPRAAWCWSLRSELRSPGDSPAPLHAAAWSADVSRWTPTQAWTRSPLPTRRCVRADVWSGAPGACTGRRIYQHAWAQVGQTIADKLSTLIEGIGGTAHT
jgi:hypothetical protein